jgi:cytochrome c biogenesis protein CcdA/glutaredoxin
MKKYFGLFILLIFSIFLSFTSLTYAQSEDKIYFFYGIGCPHCVNVEKYFEDNDLYSKYPIEKKEIYSNHENALLFNSLLDKLGVSSDGRGVPTVVIGDKVIVGDTPIIQNFVSEADAFLKKNVSGEPIITQQAEPTLSPQSESTVEKKSSSLTLLAVVAGAAVDAINPCEFAVLIILMTTILATGNSRKALSSGIAFSTSIFISYFLMGLGLYTALGMGGMAHWFYKIIGWLAIILGLFNLKDYFWYGKGFLMEVPLSWRPRLKSLIKSVTSPSGAFLIGFLVSLFLLPCTSGPYIVILGMLAKHVMLAKTLAYLLLYNLIFITPMVVISLAVYKGFNPAKAEEIRQKRLKTLHLVAGIVMLAMGIVVLRGWI